MENARILVIEDHPQIAELIRYILIMLPEQKLFSYDIHLAYDGMQGLERAEEWHPDLILLDVSLPKLDGLLVLHTLRTRGDRIPVIMMTAAASWKDHFHAFRAGCEDYILKPFQPRALLQCIQKQLRKKDFSQSSPQDSQEC